MSKNYFILLVILAGLVVLGGCVLVIAYWRKKSHARFGQVAAILSPTPERGVDAPTALSLENDLRRKFDCCLDLRKPRQGGLFVAVEARRARRREDRSHPAFKTVFPAEFE